MTLCLHRGEQVNNTATRPFTLKEVEDLEKVCGLQVTHLLLFMESVINQVKTQENVVFWNDLKHTFHCDS
jgi:hypothetical protein